MARGCGCFIPLAMSVLGVGFGVQATRAWLANPEPVVTPCAALQDEPPAEWIALEGCDVDPRIAVYAPQGTPRRAWIAVRPAGGDGPAPVVVEIRDEPELLASLAAADIAGLMPDEIRASIASATGQLRSGDALGMRARRMFRTRGVALDERVFVVRVGDRPDLGSAIAWWGLGALGLAAFSMTVLSVVFPTHEAERGVVS